MQIGFPSAGTANAAMVGVTPSAVQSFIDLGYHVAVEQGSGAGASFSDESFADAGAELVGHEQAWGSDVVVSVGPVGPDDVARLRAQATIIGLLNPARNPELLSALALAEITALSLDAVPRISRAQSLDVLSSLSNIAGYRAVIEAANEYGALFGGQVTAAGTVKPARVLIVGAGVAGLAAIAAAGNLGAIVRAFDLRPEVGEQIESMGAQVVRLDSAHLEGVSGKSSDGYAKEMTREQASSTATMYARESQAADIIITTALIPNKPAPELITAEMVAAMKPGSVIVDLAAANGGNCALTQAGERVVSDNGVIVLGYTDLASRLPRQASQLFANNVVNLVRLMTPEADGQCELDLDDVVQAHMTVTRAGEITWPPPAVSVSATPPDEQSSGSVGHPPERPEKAGGSLRPSQSPAARRVLVGIGALAFVVIAANSPPALLSHFMVLALAVVLGYYVISRVNHALHTPLMAETNAISGIILVGAVLQIGSSSALVTVISFIAIVVASINVFGGFWVTFRMLSMFRKDDS